jgi:hypothetical protein
VSADTHQLSSAQKSVDRGNFGEPLASCKAQIIQFSRKPKLFAQATFVLARPFVRQKFLYWRLSLEKPGATAPLAARSLSTTAEVDLRS